MLIEFLTVCGFGLLVQKRLGERFVGGVEELLPIGSEEVLQGAGFVTHVSSVQATVIVCRVKEIG